MGKVTFDRPHHSLDVRHHLAICKPQNLVAVLRKPMIPILVICLAHVVRISIEFDYQLRFAAQKISKIWPYGHLATKFPASDFSSRQAVP